MAAPHGTLPGVASTRETTLRPDYVMEPCTWPLSAAQEEEEEASFFGGRSAAAKAPVELAPATQARVRSVRSSEDCIINFCNESKVPVHAIWLDFNGNEVQYSVIEPKAQRRYRTFVTHPWIIRETGTKQRMMLGQRMVVLGAAGEEVKAVIKCPPPLAWSLCTHKYFPASFKKLVKTLLLSHHRLRNSDNNSYLLEDLCLREPHQQYNQIQGVQSKAIRHRQAKREREPLLPSHSSTMSDAFNNCLLQVEPMCVCLEAICTYSGCYPSSFRSQASTSPSLESTSSTLVTASSSSSVAMDEWYGPPSSTTVAMDEDSNQAGGPPSRAGMLQPPQIGNPLTGQQAAGRAALTVPRRLRVPQAQLAQGLRSGEDDDDEEVSSPRSLLKASNKMLGWVVDKVNKVARPMSAPKTQDLGCGRQQQSSNPVGPFWRNDLMEMSELPAHLVLHIISLMAPTDVPQCVSYAAPEACSGILPALLESDPATWPAPPPPPPPPPPRVVTLKM